MEYQYAAYTHTGRRKNNEDSFRAELRGDSLLAVVADGLGGHANGEAASRLAVDTIFGDLEGKAPDEDTLDYGILKASRRICQAKCSGLTTVAALWLQGEYAAAAHVGDSRIYQFREGRIVFQSLDHSVIQIAIAVGDLDPSAARHHKDRNKLFRVLGEAEEAPRVDSRELTVKPGDRFLLCSDGFWEPVTEADMLRTLSRTATAQQWLEAMREILLRAGDPKQDNHTAVCILAE